MLRTILCELEGVLVQTTALRRLSMARAVQSFGGSLPDDWRSELTEPPIVAADATDALQAAGLDSDETTRDLLGIGASRFFLERVSAGGVSLADGATAFVRDAAAQVRLAIVTRARRREAELLLSHTPFADAFAFVIAEEDVPRGKPHPDPYMAALDRLRLPPNVTRDALAMEHGALGIASAVAAGVGCVAVGPFEQAHGVAPVIAIASLAAVTVPLLARLLERDPQVVV
jgi:beta-phosphoglucomutase-like phosphatase (HAD superfamily)